MMTEMIYCFFKNRCVTIADGLQTGQYPSGIVGAKALWLSEEALTI